MCLTWLLVLLLLGTLLPPMVYAQEDDDAAEFEFEDEEEGFDIEIDDEEEEEDFYSYDDEDFEEVDASYLFVDFPDKQITIGEPVKVLVSFDNRGSDTLNVTAVQAHLHSVYDYSYFIANFTAKEIGAVVPGTGQVTIDYAFGPLVLEPIDFWLSGVVYYSDSEGRQYTTAFYNSTITLVEADVELDAQLAGIYMLILSVIGAGAYYVLNSGVVPSSSSSSAPASSKKGSKKGKSSRRAAPVSSGWGDDVEVYTQKAVAKRSGRRRK